mgnify:CR=1 FL=1
MNKGKMAPAVRVDPGAAAYAVVPVGPRAVGGLAAWVGEFLGLEFSDWEIRITTDFAIAGLNQTFLGCIGPTNVLSFPDGCGGGSIVLNVQAVLREAWLYDQCPASHWVPLLSHPILHLHSVEHGPEMDAVTEATVAQATAAGNAAMVDPTPG